MGDGGDGKAARRILALALVLEGNSRSEAAQQCGMDRQTLRDWVPRYNQEGLAGLSDRPQHPQSDPEAQELYKKFADLVRRALPEQARGKPLEIWFQDEARIGQQGTLTRVWATRETSARPDRPELLRMVSESQVSTSVASTAE
jgi:transposase-like protein